MPDTLRDQIIDFLADLPGDDIRDAEGARIVRVYDLLEPFTTFVNTVIAEAREAGAP
jgi:hypothetical protein